MYNQEEVGEFVAKKPSKFVKVADKMVTTAGVLVAAGVVTILGYPIVEAVIRNNQSQANSGRGQTENNIIYAAKPARTLPRAVARLYNSVVSINYGDFRGSGVKIGSNLVLTAGHLVMPSGEGHPDELRCGDINDSVSDVFTQLGNQTPIVNWYGQNNGRRNAANTSDYALLRVDPDSTFARLPVAPVSASSPSIGSPVYNINYESNADQKLARLPNSQVASEYMGERIGYAAEYAGIVVGKYYGEIEIAEDLQGYGPRRYREKQSHGGASGGPVFSEQGEMFGTVVSSYNSGSASYILKSYGVHLPVNQRQAVSVEAVQPISPALIRSAERNLGPNVC